MRVYLLIFKSRLFSPAIVEHIAVSGDFDLVGVAGIGARKSGSAGKWLAAQIGYWGYWGSFWIIAATLFRAIPEKLGFPRPFRRLSSLRSACGALEIPYDEPTDVNSPEFLQKLAGLEIDAIVCFQQQILGKELLGLPRLACLNVHTGILPGFRGLRPVFWMQSLGERELGVTVHTMEDRIDTGRIVVQRKWRRRPGSSVLENQCLSYRCASQCVVEAVEKLPAIAVESLPEIAGRTPYLKAPTRMERDKAVASGTRLV